MTRKTAPPELPDSASEAFSDADTHGSRTNAWFAEGEQAEAALQTLTRSAPLPAVYLSAAEEQPSPTRPRPLLLASIAAAVVILTLLALLMH